MLVQMAVEFRCSSKCLYGSWPFTFTFRCPGSLTKMLCLPPCISHCIVLTKCRSMTFHRELVAWCTVVAAMNNSVMFRLFGCPPPPLDSFWYHRYFLIWLKETYLSFSYHLGLPRSWAIWMIGAEFTRTLLISARVSYSASPLTGLLCSAIICVSQYVMWILWLLSAAMAPFSGLAIFWMIQFLYWVLIQILLVLRRSVVYPFLTQVSAWNQWGTILIS